jgi:hypothetical protein
MPRPPNPWLGVRRSSMVGAPGLGISVGPPSCRGKLHPVAESIRRALLPVSAPNGVLHIRIGRGLSSAAPPRFRLTARTEARTPSSLVRLPLIDSPRYAHSVGVAD